MIPCEVLYPIYFGLKTAHRHRYSCCDDAAAASLENKDTLGLSKVDHHATIVAVVVAIYYLKQWKYAVDLSSLRLSLQIPCV
jgi:hypothetical protein